MPSIYHIKESLSKNASSILGVNSRYSVLLPLISVKSQLNVLYEVRSSNLRQQPGEVSFPGGKIEPGESQLDAALRETQEELNISATKVEIFDEIDTLVTPYNMLIYSYVGQLHIDPTQLNPNPAEVQDIVLVPIQFFINNKPQLYHTEVRTELPGDFPYQLVPNGSDYNWRVGRYPVPFYNYQGTIIWGITARITSNFVDIISR